MNRSAALRGGALALVLVIGFLAGAYVDQAYPEFVPYLGHRSASRIDLTEVQEAARLIQADYVDSNIDTKKLSQGSVQGLVNGLGDPYSIYFDADQYKKLQASYQGRYTGIGIYLSFNTGYPVITGTVPGSPAATAGLKTGDQIVKVGDKDVKGITADAATSLIQGAEGTKVTLAVLRGSDNLTFTITRAQIQVPTVRSSMVGNRVLYVRIYQFGAQTSSVGFERRCAGPPWRSRWIRLGGGRRDHPIRHERGNVRDEGPEWDRPAPGRLQAHRAGCPAGRACGCQ